MPEPGGFANSCRHWKSQPSYRVYMPLAVAINKQVNEARTLMSMLSCSLKSSTYLIRRTGGGDTPASVGRKPQFLQGEFRKEMRETCLLLRVLQPAREKEKGTEPSMTCGRSNLFRFIPGSCMTFLVYMLELRMHDGNHSVLKLPRAVRRD